MKDFNKILVVCSDEGFIEALKENVSLWGGEELLERAANSNEAVAKLSKEVYGGMICQHFDFEFLKQLSDLNMVRVISYHNYTSKQIRDLGATPWSEEVIEDTIEEFFQTATTGEPHEISLKKN